MPSVERAPPRVLHNPLAHRHEAGFPMMEKCFRAFPDDWKLFPEPMLHCSDYSLDS